MKKKHLGEAFIGLSVRTQEVSQEASLDALTCATWPTSSHKGGAIGHLHQSWLSSSFNEGPLL